MRPRSVVDVLRVCIVGAGPAGLYTVDRILKRFRTREIKIDIVDRLPFPFGLARTGVAPDHPQTKKVCNIFARILKAPQCRFFGKVQVGKDIQFSELRELYHACVLAYGAEGERHLGIEGEDGKGVINGQNFVWWYNGHPDRQGCDVDLSKSETVAIVGAGNVALDCARILLKPGHELEQFDISPHVLDVLKKSSVKHVYIIARKSAVDIKFTPKELREILSLTHVRKNINAQDLLLSKTDALKIKNQRSRTRAIEVMHAAIQEELKARFDEEHFDRELSFVFKRRISKIHFDEEPTLCGIDLRETHGDLDFTEPNEIHEHLHVDCLIKCIGSQTMPIAGVPFDRKNNAVPNEGGRVRHKHGVEKGLYVAGWAGRVPSGIIGTNVIDAEDVANALHEDVMSGIEYPIDTACLETLLDRKEIVYTSLKKY